MTLLFVMNLGFAWGAVTAAEVPGLEYAVTGPRTHYAVAENSQAHFEVKKSRLHYEVFDEDLV